MASGLATLTAGAGRPTTAGWPVRNARLLAVFAPLLVAAGALGLLLPGAGGPLSAAPAYDVFHLAFGGLGAAIVLARRHRAAALFNLGFGAIDLYQAVAGVLGFFPAALFELRSPDHVVHALFGVLLVGFGARGLGRK
jgi:hypothetical protein